MSLPISAGFDTSHTPTKVITPSQAPQEFKYSLKEEKVNHFVGLDAQFQGGRLHYGSGLVISGQVIDAQLIVDGTLIVREGAMVSGSIHCKRLIALGALDCTSIVVDELAVCWSGSVSTTEGFYVSNVQVSDQCVVKGKIFDVSEMTKH